MANKTVIFSPKKEIIDHFDSLINRVDIDIDQCLEKYNQEQFISELKCFDIGQRNVRGQMAINLNGLSEEDIEYETVDEWPESAKVVDYLNRIRMRTIEELRKAQDETLEYYKQNRSQFKLNSMDEIRSELFKDNFHFQVLYKPDVTKNTNLWVFNLYTIVTDFYISSTHINLLEKLINFSEYKHFDSELVLDEVNLSASKTFDLCNIDTLELYGKNTEEIKIEGFSSLKYLSIRFDSLNQVILTNLIELRKVELYLDTPINTEFLLKLIENSPYIEILHLRGKLSHFNLDSLSNLKELHLIGTIMDDFNFHVFDNLCNRLEYIDICCTNLDDKLLEKLFYDRNFPYLSTFCINFSKANIILEKKLFDGLRMLQKLEIYKNKNVRIIDIDLFSNLIELQELNLSHTSIEFIDKTLFSNLIKLKKLSLYSNRFESIEENLFSYLHNLEYLDLSFNQLRSLSAKSFVGLDNLKELDLRDNKLVNFDLDIFDNIGKIEKIYLRGNPIMNNDVILNRS